MVVTVRDAHTHFFSRVYFETLGAQAPGERPVGELEEVARQAGIELPGADSSAHLQRWLSQLEAAGVASAVTFASVPEEAEVVAEACRASEGRLSGYVVLNPLAPQAEAMVDRALGELGLRGIVLFPAMHHYHLSDEACRPVLKRLREHGGICVAHCGILKLKLRDLFGFPRSHDARYASPLSVVRAAGEFSEVPFVIPHFGAGMFREVLLAGSWCQNIYVDTSSSNNWIVTQVPRLQLRDVFASTLDVFGSRRILFGTDSSTFPRGYRKDLLDLQTRALQDLEVSDGDTTAIFGGNLQRLLD
jgi:hypothetical protein